MKNPIDRILSDEQELMPSSGFLGAVIEQVRAEAAAPSRIPFPWRRAIPGMLLAGGVLGWGAAELARYGIQAAAASHSAPRFDLSRLAAQPVETAGWIAIALAFSAMSWFVARRMIGPDGLL